MIRTFTKEDWYGLAGCQPWGVDACSKDSSLQPLILSFDQGVLEDWQVVADKNGVEAFGPENANGEPQQYKLDIQFQTQLTAKVFLQGLAFRNALEEEDDTELGLLKVLGFESLN